MSKLYFSLSSVLGQIHWWIQGMLLTSPPTGLISFVFVLHMFLLKSACIGGCPSTGRHTPPQREILNLQLNYHRCRSSIKTLLDLIHGTTHSNTSLSRRTSHISATYESIKRFVSQWRCWKNKKKNLEESCLLGICSNWAKLTHVFFVKSTSE